MTKLDWENITNYIDSVGTTDTVFPFTKVQSSVKVTASGARDNIIYTIGGQSGTLTPGQSVMVTGTISSMTLRSASGKQPFQVWATEAGTEKDETDTSYQGQIDGLTTQLAQNTSLTGANTSNLQTTYTNGNLTQVKEFDVNNTLLIQQDITYNSDGTINTITETINGKQYLTTLNYVNGSLDTVNPMTRSVI